METATRLGAAPSGPHPLFRPFARPSVLAIDRVSANCQAVETASDLFLARWGVRGRRLHATVLDLRSRVATSIPDGRETFLQLDDRAIAPALQAASADPTA